MQRTGMRDPRPVPLLKTPVGLGAVGAEGGAPPVPGATAKGRRPSRAWRLGQGGTGGWVFQKLAEGTWRELRQEQAGAVGWAGAGPESSVSREAGGKWGLCLV